MDIKMERTERGFQFFNFKDRYGSECSMQESSFAEEAAIWFGAKEIGLKRFDPKNGGWKDIELENDAPYGVCHVANNRMHLTQDMVKDLLPALQYFAEHGYLPEPEAVESKGEASSPKIL